MECSRSPDVLTQGYPAGLTAGPGAPRQFIPSFVHPLGAESVPGSGEIVVPHGDACFVGTVTLPYPASLLVLSRDRPWHTESSHLVLLWRKVPPKQADLEKGVLKGPRPLLSSAVAEVRALWCGGPELSLWSSPLPLGAPGWWKCWERRGVPWVLTEQVLGACVDVHSLNKPAVITDLPDELLTATTLARILR